MNTTNNLENEKLPVNEVESDNNLQSEQTEQETSSVESQSVNEAESEKEIDYDLDDAHIEDESESEEDEIDEDTVSEDSSAVLLSIEEIIQHLRDLLEKGNLKRKHVEEYKNQFYRSLRNEIETQKQAFFAEGGEEIDFVATEPEIYNEGKELLQKLKRSVQSLLQRGCSEREEC